MSDLYLDEIEKIKYWRQKITDQFLERGVVAGKEKVQERLDKIDLKIAVFSQAYIKSGEILSVDKFNEQKQDIYQDLFILYRLLYHLAEQRVEKARMQIRYALDDLREKAKQYQYLTDIQTISVYGKTIFRKASGFEQEYKDGQVIIDLGPITVASGSYLAPIISGNNISAEQVTFVFKSDDETEIRSAPYEFSKNYVRIAGNYQLKTQSYKCTDKQLGKELISVTDKLQDTSQYNLFLNKDKIRVRNETDTRYIEKYAGIYYTAAEQEEVSFYVYGASFIKINTIGEIESKNFAGNEILSPAQRQKIVIRGKQFSFDVQTDGILYAEKAPAEIMNGQLSISENYDDITDYMVEDIAYGDDITFSNVQVIIDDATGVFYDIEYILIKQAQISELEDQT